MGKKSTYLIILLIGLLFSNTGFGEAKGDISERPLSSWAGTWYRVNGSGTITLRILNETAQRFDFVFQRIYFSDHTEIKGIAQKNGSKAVYIENGMERISFTFENGTIAMTTLIQSSSDNPCDGLYSRTPPWEMGLFQRGIVGSDAQDKIFKDYLKPTDYEWFKGAFNHFSKDEDQDGFGAQVITGNTEYTRAILMMKTNGKFWAAYQPDSRERLNKASTIIADDSIIYYTNVPEWKNRLPKTIANWRKDDTDGKYLQVICVVNPPFHVGTDNLILYPAKTMVVLSLGDRSLLFYEDSHRIMRKTPTQTLALTYNLGVSRPSRNPDQRRCAYAYPVDWELIGEVFVYDIQSDQTETVLTKRDFPAQHCPKAVAWLDGRYLAIIIGFAYGTITEGGDLYIFDTQNRKLAMAMKASNNEFIEFLAVGNDTVTLRQVHFLETEKSDKKEYQLQTYRISELLQRAGMK